MRLHRAFLCAMVVIAACAPTAPAPPAPTLFVFRLDSPAYIELDSSLRPSRELPFGLPEGCGVSSVFPAPRGPLLAIELACAFGPAVVWLDADKGEVNQPITSSDSHFLAWSPEGDVLYLKVNSVNRPQIVRHKVGGATQELGVADVTYDVSPSPRGDGLLFSYSQGMGLGSEMWYQGTRVNGSLRRIALDEANYLSLARWSPDGQQIALVKIPDSTTAFTIGELWVMRADGAGARRLAYVDAGHGFPPVWSPDGTRIAFVARENPGDAHANTSSAALLSNIHVVRLDDGAVRPITAFQSARVESPAWQPEGENLAFAAVVDDRMTVFVKNLTSDEMQQVMMDMICCVGWLRK